MRYDTVFVTRKVFFYGLLAMIPYYLLKPDEAIIFTPAVVQFFNLPILLNLLFLGCVASMTCFLAWNWVLKKLGPVIATNYVYFNPVTTILFAWVVLSEQITIYFILGTILILAGLYLTEKKR
jgi:drug/metabolite transporter (DMT)-like permease